MAETRRLLILGGTGDALDLAARADALAKVSVITSLAGRTRTPHSPAGEVRSGGFGGADGLEAYLRREAIDWVVDATHPFAAKISANATSACTSAAVPLLTLHRPEWKPRPGDRWIDAATVAEAARIAAEYGSRIFVTIGRNELAPFAGRPELFLLVRLIEPPDDSLGLVDFETIAGRGPFAVADEISVLENHRIDCVVSKNSGGDATYAKIEAARELGLPVVMVRRPDPPPGETVDDVDSAFEWIENRRR